MVKNHRSLGPNHSIENIGQESYFTENIIKFRDLITKGEYPKMEIFLQEDSASGYVLPKQDCEHLEEHAKIKEISSIDACCQTWLIILFSVLSVN